MCDLAKILLGLGSTIGALGTFGVAIFAYRLASKNFAIIADKHDREAVSVVFDRFKCENYLIYPTFIIYNNANVALQIEGIELTLHKPNMGWSAKVEAHINGRGYVTDLGEWNQEGLKDKRAKPHEFIASILKPREHARVKCEYLTSKNMDNNFVIGHIQARLCYDGAKSRSYELRIPRTPENEKLIKAQQVVHDNRNKNR